MSILTAQRISQLYSDFKNIDVTFNSNVNKALGMVPREIYLKCLGNQFRCVIYSSSLAGAKVVMSIDEELLTLFRKANNLVSLRFCFMDPEKSVPISFFVSSKIMGLTPYGKDSPQLHFISLAFTSQPPDDLVALLGLLVEANINAKRRSEERIPLNTENVRKLQIKVKSSVLSIAGIPRPCILRDLSFSGTLSIISGIGKFLIGKEALVQLEFEDINKKILLKGVVKRFEAVEGRRELSALGIHFHPESLPMEYKMKVNEFLTSKGKGPVS